MQKYIDIKGAREHNLKNVSCQIPKNKFVVITGLSGSGKSSLAFDTIYAEGQRRYLESLSAYARQFMEQMKKPELDSIEGLSPTISIEQKNVSRNPRSTVGTITEIYDYLRLLYARVGQPFCTNCQKPIEKQSLQQIVSSIMRLPLNEKFTVMAPLARDKKGEFQKELRTCRERGFLTAWIDGEEVELARTVHRRLSKTQKHTILVPIDKLVMKPGIEARLGEALEISSELCSGLVAIETWGDKKLHYYSTKLGCPDCGVSFAELEPRSFSFNSPHGACEKCKGLGVVKTFDADLVISDPSFSLRAGAIAPWIEKTRSWQERMIGALARKFDFKPDTPWREIPESAQKGILFGLDSSLDIKPGKSKRPGEDTFEGVIPFLESLLREAEYEEDIEWLEQFQTPIHCPKCDGMRLKPESLMVLISGFNISQLSSLSIDELLPALKKLELKKGHLVVAEPILKEISLRIQFLCEVGLGYLTLLRSMPTLSGGEAQRVRLATQIGSAMVGVLYVLDEPSIGLHQRDNQNLLATLKKLRDQGNSVIVVEHDEETIEDCDFVVDMGPGAGRFGGEISFIGKPSDLKKSDCLTGQYLSGKKKIHIPQKRRDLDKRPQLRLEGVKKNNLNGVSVSFPLGTFIGVSGVSGSGKSSLIIDTLLPSVRQYLRTGKSTFDDLEKITGLEAVDKIIHVDQSPIGRTPRSNPATYTGIFTEIRKLYAQMTESKVRGYGIGRFSFNVKGGRCEACRGDGNLKISMHFLPDVYVPCEVCQGKRYNRETLQVRYKGKNIADVLEMSIEEACEFFNKIPSIYIRLKTLVEVGLDYIKVGQSALTLSGGEAQRLKLSRELNKKSTGKTIYILDEPTTGLHFEDIAKLLEILHKLVEAGNTVFVIEHHLDVLKQADYLVDLGPEGGRHGGEVLFSGSPEDLGKIKASHTGRFLKALF